MMYICFSCSYRSPSPGCMDGGPRTNPPLGAKPTSPPNAGPMVAPDGETPQQAAARLLPQALTHMRSSGATPGSLLQGAAAGRVVAMSSVYSWPAYLVRWVLPEDRDAVAAGDLFARMWPSAMSADAFVAPMVKRGVSVCEFGVGLQHGRWVIEAYDGVSSPPVECTSWRARAVGLSATTLGRRSGRAADMLRFQAGRRAAARSRHGERDGPARYASRSILPQSGEPPPAGGPGRAGETPESCGATAAAWVLRKTASLRAPSGTGARRRSPCCPRRRPRPRA